MSKKILSGLSVAALTCAAMLTLESGPAAAFTLSGPQLSPVGSVEVQKVYYRAAVVRRGVYRGGVYRGGVYRGVYGYHPYGYGGAAAVGAAAIGAAAIGAAVLAPRCWINPYGVQVCN